MPLISGYRVKQVVVPMKFGRFYLHYQLARFDNDGRRHAIRSDNKHKYYVCVCVGVFICIYIYMFYNYTARYKCNYYNYINYIFFDLFVDV